MYCEVSSQSLMSGLMCRSQQCKIIKKTASLNQYRLFHSKGSARFSNTLHRNFLAPTFQALHQCYQNFFHLQGNVCQFFALGDQLSIFPALVFIYLFTKPYEASPHDSLLSHSRRDIDRITVKSTHLSIPLAATSFFITYSIRRETIGMLNNKVIHGCVS